MKKIIFLGIYFLSPMIMIRILYGINPIKYGNFNFFISMSLGIAAYNWLIWQFILSSRPKFIDAIIGLDKIYRLHGVMAIVSILLAIIHNSFLNQMFGDTNSGLFGEVAILIYVAVSVISVFLLTKSKWKKIKILGLLKNFLSDRIKIKYEHFKEVHNLSIIGLVSMQIHVLMTSNARQYNTIYRMYMLYFILAVVFYSYHKFIRPWIIKEDKWLIEAVHKLSLDVYEIKMSLDNKKINYHPGQFGFFKMKVGDRYETHPFSFTSSPLDHHSITIAVKILGDFTRRLDQLKVGDLVYIDGPYGDFSYTNYGHENKSFFIAGGIGITPIISMIRYMSIKEPLRKVTLLWGIRTRGDYLYKNDLVSLMKKMPNLKVIPVISREEDYSGERGYINYDLLLKYLSPMSIHDKREGYYICGPSVLMKNTRCNLDDLGIHSSRIHYESF